MQQCINVTLPKAIGGLEGKAAYLDCDAGLSFRRLDEICQATKAMVLPVLVNGDEQDEPFTNEDAQYEIGPIVVPSDNVLVLRNAPAPAPLPGQPGLGEKARCVMLVDNIINKVFK